jgi:hypothetical protein
MDMLVECELQTRLVLSRERSLPVHARLTYRAQDPYAVRVAFHVGPDAPVTWTFARELLVEGVFRPCGEGDVRVWPAKVQGRDLTCVALSSPDGDALLEMPSSAVSGWLERTLRLVPPGRESEILGVDAALADLLAGGRADDARLPSDESGDAEV